MKKRDNKASIYNKKNVIMSIILVVLLIVLVIGSTYAIFSYVGVGKQSNVISSGALTFSYTESSNGIYLENAMPMSDSIGKTLQNDGKNNGYFDFNVSAKIVGTNTINYEVYTSKINTSVDLNTDYVKIYLIDTTTNQPLTGYDGVVPTYSSLPDSSIDSSSKRLYSGSFSSTGVQSFRLRMWVADSYNVTPDSKQFKIKVNVKATN